MDDLEFNITIHVFIFINKNHHIARDNKGYSIIAETSFSIMSNVFHGLSKVFYPWH